MSALIILFRNIARSIITTAHTQIRKEEVDLSISKQDDYLQEFTKVTE